MSRVLPSGDDVQHETKHDDNDNQHDQYSGIDVQDDRDDTVANVNGDLVGTDESPPGTAGSQVSLQQQEQPAVKEHRTSRQKSRSKVQKGQDNTGNNGQPKPELDSETGSHESQLEQQENEEVDSERNNSRMRDKTRNLSKDNLDGVNGYLGESMNSTQSQMPVKKRSGSKDQSARPGQLKPIQNSRSPRATRQSRTSDHYDDVSLYSEVDDEQTYSNEMADTFNIAHSQNGSMQKDGLRKRNWHSTDSLLSVGRPGNSKDGDKGSKFSGKSTLNLR